MAKRRSTCYDAYRDGSCALKLAQIRRILFPPEEPERSWTPDTIDEVARVVGFPQETKPKRRRRRR